MSLFGKLLPNVDPMKKIVEHAKVIEEESKHLKEMFEKYFSGESIDDIYEKIDKYEQDADRIKGELRRELKKEYKYRFDRFSILNYIDRQDKIADYIQDVGKLLTLNTFIPPKEIQEKIYKIIDVVQDTIDKFEDSVKKFEDYVNSDFSPQYKKTEDQDIETIVKRERLIDDMLFEIGKWYYSEEVKENYNAIDLMFFREVTLKISKIADSMENVTDIIKIMING
jgi:predicted phosphate transport protein (TIGR00153 family)